jgi:hypothetical protein
MGISRLRIGVAGLAWCSVLALGLARAEAPVLKIPPPSDAEVKEQARQVEQNKDKAARLAAVKWFNQRSWSKNAALGIPALEHCIRKDSQMELRREAVQSLAMIAKRLGQPCPLVILEALLDREEEVRWQASADTVLFKTFAPGAVEVLFRCVRSEDDSMRADSLLLLARVAGKDRKVLDVIEKAKQDKTFQVRHAAYCAMFQANDKVDEFLGYMIRVQEDPEAVLSPAEENSETWKRERAMRTLVLLGSAVRMIEWSDERPDDLAPALLKLLEDKSPVMRRGAARMIGAAVVKVNLPDPAKAGMDWQMKVLAPYFDPDKEDTSPPKGAASKDRPQKSRVGVRLEKLKVVEHLRKLRDNDPDPAVRFAARTALKRLAQVQEPSP